MDVRGITLHVFSLHKFSKYYQQIKKVDINTQYTLRRVWRHQRGDGGGGCQNP